MLYLEDYIEMIEHLPQELRDRFSEMKELDYQVQNSLENLDKRVNTFFSNAKKMTANEKEAEFEAIKKEYYRSLEDADEKIALANNMSDVVGKYYRRLDQELHKFKMELEADNMGITEILEKRSTEKEVPASNSISQKENRYNAVPPQRTYYGDKRVESGSSQGLVVLPKQSNVGLTQSRPLDVVGGTSSASSNIQHNTQLSHAHSSSNYGLSHMGQAGRTAIAAAASQAIAATQQMQQGRRTASLKASYEAIGGSGIVGTASGTGSSAQEISKEIAGAAQTAIAAIQDSHKKHKTSSSLSGSSSGGSSSGRKTNLSQLVGGVSPAASLPSPDTPTDRTAELVDPNEARYCICNEVAYGMMVACDNKTCRYEWYHYPCVGISEKPKGKWYCPHCTAAMKRNRNRK